MAIIHPHFNILCSSSLGPGKANWGKSLQSRTLPSDSLVFRVYIQRANKIRQVVFDLKWNYGSAVVSFHFRFFECTGGSKLSVFCREKLFSVLVELSYRQCHPQRQRRREEVVCSLRVSKNGSQPGGKEPVLDSHSWSSSENLLFWAISSHLLN